MRATYYISFNGTDYTRFYPTNEPKVKLTPVSGEIFSRWYVDSFKIGKTKNISVYADLKHYFETPAHFTGNINYRIQENGVTTYKFIGSILKGKIDKQNSIYDCTPDPDDDYRDILGKYENKYQDRTLRRLFGLEDTIYYPTLGTDKFDNISFTSFTDTTPGLDVVWQNSTFGATQTAEYDTDYAFIGNTVLIEITNFVLTLGNEPEMQLIDESSKASKSNKVTITADGWYTLTQTGNAANIDIQLSQLNNLPDAGVASGSFSYKAYNCVNHFASGSLIRTVLTTVLTGVTYMNLSIPTIQSTILWNDSLESDPPASIDIYITANPTNDYVIEDTAIWNYLWLSRVDALATTMNLLFECSLKDIMALLKKIRMYWFIDSDGHFRIEHEEYFRSFDPQADLSTYVKDRAETDHRIYNYEIADLYQQINYSENNQGTSEWLPYPVLFSTNGTSTNKKDVMFSDLTTDLEYVRDNPDAASNSGFLLMRTVKTGSLYYVPMDQGTLVTTNYYANGKLSWAWVLHNYCGYFAEALTGTVNNGHAITYDHVKEFLKQEGVAFHPTINIDWRKPFTLLNGTGWLTSAEYSPETGMASINVGYNPYV